jgi:hypothetical protein
MKCVKNENEKARKKGRLINVYNVFLLSKINNVYIPSKINKLLFTSCQCQQKINVYE